MRTAKTLTALSVACLVAVTMAGCRTGPRQGRPVDGQPPGAQEATLPADPRGWRLGPFRQVVNLAWLSPRELGYRVRYDGLDELGRLDVAVGSFRPAVAVGQRPEEGNMYLGDLLPADAGCLYSVLDPDRGGTFLVRPDGEKEKFATGFYRTSPSGRTVVLFTAPPLLLHPAARKTVTLPAEMDHGWPAHWVGLCWSPAEELLAYEDWSTHSIAIARTADGVEVARIHAEGWQSIEPTWSPDGKKLAFLSWPIGEPYAYHGEYDFRLPIGRRLGVRDLETGEVIYVPGQPQVFGHPVWSPDSRRVAFQAGKEQPGGEVDYLTLGEIWVYDLETGEIARVTSERSGSLGKNPAAWSPQGDRLLFSSTHREPGFASRVFWILDLPTGLETEVGTPHTESARWLPDGRLLRAGPGADGRSPWALELLKRPGDVTRLLEAPRISAVVVSPDGTHVALALVEGENREFVVVLRP